MGKPLRTDRLTIRDWTEDDVAAALAVYGRPEVARWLSPALAAVTDADGMRELLLRWITETRESEAALGHWAIEIAETGAVVGGVSLHPLPVDEQDVEIGWQIVPESWNLGYGSEAGQGVIRRAFDLDIDEVFARSARPTSGPRRRRAGSA